MTSTASRCLNRAKVCGCASHAPCYCHPSPGAIQSSAMAPDEFVAAAGKLVQRRPPGTHASGMDAPVYATAMPSSRFLEDRLQETMTGGVVQRGGARHLDLVAATLAGLTPVVVLLTAIFRASWGKASTLHRSEKLNNVEWQAAGFKSLRAIATGLGASAFVV